MIERVKEPRIIVGYKSRIIGEDPELDRTIDEIGLDIRVVPVYLPLREVEISGEITEHELYERSRGREIVFERDDVALEGRLYLRGKNGEYLDDSHSKRKRNRGLYVVKVTDSDSIPTPWDEVTSGLAVRNKIYDHWDIYLKLGDKLTFLDGIDSLKKYVFNGTHRIKR